jgi:hypothetical protein
MDVMRQILHQDQYHHRARHILASAVAKGRDIVAAVGADAATLKGFSLLAAAETLAPLFERTKLRQVVDVWLLHDCGGSFFILDRIVTKYDYLRNKYVQSFIKFLREDVHESMTAETNVWTLACLSIKRLEELQQSILRKGHLLKDDNVVMRYAWAEDAIQAECHVIDLLRSSEKSNPARADRLIKMVEFSYRLTLTAESLLTDAPLDVETLRKKVSALLVACFSLYAEQSDNGSRIPQTTLRAARGFCEMRWPEMKGKAIFAKRKLKLKKSKKNSGLNRARSQPAAEMNCLSVEPVDAGNSAKRLKVSHK